MKFILPEKKIPKIIEKNLHLFPPSEVTGADSGSQEVK